MTATTDYLAQYDAAAEADKFPLVRHWLDTEPLPFFKQLREQRPILVTPVCTLLARFDDITEVLNMPKVFTVELYIAKMGDYLMAHDDDALHTREKSLMQGLLNRDDLPQVRALVARIGKAILDGAGTGIEVVNDYCRMVPATLVQDYFGLTGCDKKDLIEWSYWNQYDNFHNHPFDLMPEEKRLYIVERHNAVGPPLGAYIAELMARRLLAVKAEQATSSLLVLWYGLKKLFRLLSGKKSEPLTDDMVTRMLRTNFPDAVNFDLTRVGINAGGLLIGAIETTSQAVAQILQFLLDNSAWLDKAVIAAHRDDNKEFDSIVWEALRFVPIAPYLFRKTAGPYTVGKDTPRETMILPGTYVLTLTQSAMFDPLIFANPDDFVPERNWYHYFHFGFGSHECLGKYVGMVMIPEMVRQVLLKPGIRALGRIDYKDGPFPEQYELAWG
ncbi:cytochrome P450 [Methylovulum psychrotolerans]|uniref:Cytochrome n=1 Tax=Methylovulum psychrotolerans TaxID=1704499 RepID=A0A1Z4C412_9GAMM|nr:cytochrome P450 [Methylovulum psychrotolerans]ASF48272.1 cytochrome [Methylovulum psychrotolerans]